MSIVYPGGLSISTDILMDKDVNYILHYFIRQSVNNLKKERNLRAPFWNSLFSKKYSFVLID